MRADAHSLVRPRAHVVMGEAALGLRALGLSGNNNRRNHPGGPQQPLRASLVPPADARVYLPLGATVTTLHQIAIKIAMSLLGSKSVVAKRGSDIHDHTRGGVSMCRHTLA